MLKSRVLLIFRMCSSLVLKTRAFIFLLSGSTPVITGKRREYISISRLIFVSTKPILAGLFHVDNFNLFSCYQGLFKKYFRVTIQYKDMEQRMMCDD